MAGTERPATLLAARTDRTLAVICEYVCFI
jgi:hypothetical protein